MPELNREEIIKALEWCIQSEGCEYCEYNKGNVDVCSIRSDALTLIKQLTKENERLKERADRHLDNLKAVLDERAEENVVEVVTYRVKADGSLETIPTIESVRQDVAREIFEEIYEDCFDQFGYINYEALADLKKKYIGE